MPHDDFALVERGRQALQLEAAAVSAVAGGLDQAFVRPVQWRKPRRVLFVRSIFCVISALSVLSCEDSGVRPTTTVQAADSADQVLEGFSHYVTNQGILRSRVEADTAYFYEPTQITELRNVKVVFFDIKGAESSTLTARRGTYRWQDGSMEATGNVVVVSPDGRRLATEALRYENATNLIITDRPFTFDRGEEHLEGNSFRSDPDFQNVVTDRPRGVTGEGMLLPGQ